MKKWIVAVSIGAGLVSAQCAGQSTLEQIWQKAKTARTSNQRLSNGRIVAGLREALTVSNRNAVASTGRPDGFLKNEAIKILVPEKLRNVSQNMRLIGMGGQVDALEVGMNRAAKQAAPAAK